jgi:CheY-like chemotaxis protein
VVRPAEIPEEVLDYIKSERIEGAPDNVYLQIVGNQIMGAAEDEAKKRGAKSIETTVLDGDPADKIINYAKDLDVDVIVMGSRGLGHFQGQILGSVVTKVCHTTDRTCVIARKRLLDGARLLIVDDEPDVLETLEELLPMCDVVKATSFNEGRELLETQHFDMAIFDIMGVDGYGLLQIAKEKEVTALMLTAHALSLEDTEKAYKQGAASYVPKDKISSIATYLNDVLEAKEKGKHFWWRWLERFGAYYDKRFGPGRVGKILGNT